MTTQRVGHVQWLDFYPIEEQLLSGFDSSDPKSVLLVDVGGSVGHEIQAVKKRYPSIPGRMVLQDRPATIERVKAENGMEVMAHDFFTEQPIKGTFFPSKTTSLSKTQLDLTALQEPEPIIFGACCTIGTTIDAA